MKKLSIIFILLLFFATFVSPSFGDDIYQGTIYWINGNPVGNGYEVAETMTTLDRIYFTVNSPGTIEIDVLSTEQSDESGEFVDVNGDGEVAFIDPYIYLFRDDGSLHPSDLIAENDDSDFGVGVGDGSVGILDSFLSLMNLDAGSYILLVGDYDLYSLAVFGINSYTSNGPITFDPSTGNNAALLVADHGDYQVTFRGDVSILPAVEHCEGDFSNDGDVDGSDLAVFASDFGRTDCP